jgi:hypothetical protein
MASRRLESSGTGQQVGQIDVGHDDNLARWWRSWEASGRPWSVSGPGYLVTVGGGALFANPVEAALLGAPAHPDAEDIRAHAEAVADVLIAGIAVTPPGPGPDGTADGRASSP